MAKWHALILNKLCQNKKKYHMTKMDGSKPTQISSNVIFLFKFFS